jgi:hypothetical protein
MILELEWWQIALAVVVAILGAARLTRLIVHDTFPPIVAFRVWYLDHARGGWDTLVECHWCMGPWMFLVAILTFLLTPLWLPIAYAWWIFYIWMAGSYLVSQYVHFDQGRDE